MPIQEKKTHPGQREASTQTDTSTSRRRLLRLLGAGGVAGLAGCSSGSKGGTKTDTKPGADTGTGTGTKTSTETRELTTSATIGIPVDITSDFNAPWGGVSPYYARILETLTWPTQDIKGKPWLAKDLKRTGELTWEVTLRDDVKFHNGKPLNAEAVDFSMHNFGCCVGFIYNLKETEKSTDENRKFAIRKVDDLTVEFTTSEPTANFPARLSHAFGAIQHPDRTEKKPIGTGPYKFEDMKEGQYVKVSAFDDYWRGTPNMKELKYRVMTDRNTRALTLTGHNIDIGLDLPTNQYEALKNANKSNAVTIPKTWTTFGVINTKTGPLTDVKLRKALNWAVSQKKIVDGALNGVGRPANGSISDIIWWSAEESLPAYGPDKAKAKNLVKQSSYDGETVKILFVGGSNRVQAPKLVSQVIQQAAKDVGINFEIRSLGDSAFSEHVDAATGGHIYMEAQGAPYAAGDFLLIGDWHSERIDWRAEPMPDKVDQLLDKGEQATDPKVKKEAYGEVQQIMMEKALILPMNHQSYVAGVYKDVAEFNFHPIPVNNRWENLNHFK